MASIAIPQSPSIPRTAALSRAALVRTALIAIVFAFGLLPRLQLVLASADSITRIVPDDVGYYLQTARHIVAGQGSTFDGLHATNGYHPLWMALLLPLAWAIHDPWTLLRVVLLVSMLLNLGTAILVFRLLQRVSDRWYIGLAAGGLYLLNPRSVIVSMDGLETSLETFLLVTCLAALLHAANDRTARAAALFGATSGLLFLARTDSVCFLAPLGLLFAAWHWRAPLRILQAGVCAAGLALPWLAWNWWQFDTIMQSSGDAVPYVQREGYLLAGHTPAQWSAVSVDRLRDFLQQTFWPWLGYAPWIVYGAAVIVLLASAPSLRTRLALPAAYWHLVLAVAACWAGGLALTYVHVVVRAYPRPYYFDTLMLLAALTCALALAVAARPLERPLSHRAGFLRPLGFVAVIGVATAGLSSVSLAVQHGEYPWQVDMADAGRFLAAHTDPGTRIVSFNAGLAAFVSDRAVINLDGCADNAAFDAIKQHRLAAFALASGARYYLDYEPTMSTWYAPFLGAGTGALIAQPAEAFDRSGLAAPDHTLRLFLLSSAHR